MKIKKIKKIKTKKIKKIKTKKTKKQKKTKNLVLPLKYSRCIWYFSFIHLFAGIYGIINNHYFLASLSLGAVLTSINYWGNPLSNCWGRYLDIVYIQISLYCHIYYGLKSKMKLGYLYFLSISITCYFLSYYFKKKYYSTLFHIMVHVFGCMANTLLYSG